MSQTSVIFGALVIGFIVYITTKGRLPAYVATLWATAPSSTNAGAGGTPVSSMDTGQLAQAANLPGMPAFSTYQDTLPSMDQGIVAAGQATFTGFYPSGLPSYSELAGFNRDASTNVLNGLGPL